VKPLFHKLTVLVLLWTLLPIQANASWLSDALGVNADPWAGKFEIGTPQPIQAVQQLPGVIQRLPQDAGNLFNPAGLALAAAVRQAKAQASFGARPVPPNVYQSLSPYFPPGMLTGVRYNTFDRTRITLDSAVMLLNNDVAAITLDDVIVFRNESEAQNLSTWAHELTHVLQYRARGIDTFANTYTTNAWVLENEAKDAQARIGFAISGNLAAARQFAYFNVTGQILYGDAVGNLYPVDPRTGVVIGPSNGRVYFQNGMYWAVDMSGRTFPAMRVG
jgi:hypothetical protein